MGEIGRAMLKVGFVTKEQLEKAEREAAEKIVNKWREKYGSDTLSLLLFKMTFSQYGLEAVKSMLKD